MPGWARCLSSRTPADAQGPWKQAVGAGQRRARPPSPLAPSTAPRAPRGEGALAWAVLQPGVNEKISLNQKSTPLHTCVRASRCAAQHRCRLRCAAPRHRAQRQVLPDIKKKKKKRRRQQCPGVVMPGRPQGSSAVHRLPSSQLVQQSKTLCSSWE